MQRDPASLLAGTGAVAILVSCAVLAIAAPQPSAVLELANSRNAVALIEETRRQNSLEFYAILVAVVSVVCTGLGLFAKLTRFITSMEAGAVQLRADLQRITEENVAHRAQNESAAKEIFQRLAHLEGRLDRER